MKKLIVIAVLLFMVGCEGKAILTQKTDNSDFDVETLFTDKDGYTVKRFKAAGVFYYYVTPGPSKVLNVVTKSTGKAVYDISDELTTLGKKPSPLAP